MRASDPTLILGPIRTAVQEIDSTQELFAVRSLSTGLHDMSGGVRVVAALVTMLTVLALLVAAAGVYAVVSYMVVLRQRDLAIRMALGARAADVLQLFASGIGKLVVFGVSLGLLAGVGLGRVIERALTIVSVEYVLLLASGTIIILTSVAAIYMPVRRASLLWLAILLR